MSALRHVLSERVARRRSDQRGIALIEFLVALVVLSITVGGIAAATISAGSIGKHANDAARSNVLMTAFGEAIKALPYEDCALPDVYQSAFDDAEADAALGPDAADILTASGADLTAVDVVTDTDCPPDPGVQTVTLNVRYRDGDLTREIVKRNPALQEPLDFCMYSPIPRAELDPAEAAKACPDDDATLQRSGTNDPLVVWGLRSGGESQIFKYEWWCDGAWEVVVPQVDPVAAPDGVADSPIDAGPECRYPAPPAGSVETVRIALRVTEQGTNRTGTTSLEIPLRTTLKPYIPPVAQITVLSVPNCTSPTPCLPNTQIDFRSTGPPPAESSIVQWEWNFGDGSPTQFCTISSSDPLGQSCIEKSYSYLGGGTFPVRLWVTDTYGSRSSAATRNVIVQGAPVIRPTVNATSNLSGTPAYGVSPQAVTFDASGSHADGYPSGVGAAAGLANYYWEFGPSGAVQSGPNLTAPTYTYPASSKRETYEAKVTVTTLDGLTNYATVTIVLDPLIPPIGLANRGAHKGDIPLIRNAYFDFQWTNVPRTQGDTVTTVIKITSAGGFCGFLGVGVNYREFSVPAGAAGTTQTYRAQFSSSPRGFNGVCTTDAFTYSARTIRTNGSGTYQSAWSNPQPLDPEFF